MICKNEAVLVAAEMAKLLWGLSADLTFLGKSESYIFVASKKNDHQEVIVRIMNNNQRSIKSIQAEMDFINLIDSNNKLNKDSNINIASPILSSKQAYFHQLENNYIAMAFNKVPGEFLKPKEVAINHFHDWGKMIAEFHLITDNHASEIKSGKAKPIDRFNWYDHPLMKEFLATNQPGIPVGLKDKIFNYLNSLPKDSSTYNLIHGDLHPRNVHVEKIEDIKNIEDKGKDQNQTYRYHVFDFDDCSYHWYVYDLAVSIYQFYVYTYTKEQHYSLEEIKKEFLVGYLSKRHLSPYWIEQIDRFIVYRALLIDFAIDYFIKHGDLHAEDMDKFARAKQHARNVLWDKKNIFDQL